jgi:sodium pump decarboxylase gamma subunit
LILIINMTVVFFVLFVLELLTRGIYYIDPTRKKTVPAAPAAAVEPPAAVAAETVEESGDDLAVVAVIAAALAAMGESGRVSVIRRIDGTSWTQMGRMDAVNVRTQMY